MGRDGYNRSNPTTMCQNQTTFSTMSTQFSLSTLRGAAQASSAVGVCFSLDDDDGRDDGRDGYN